MDQVEEPMQIDLLGGGGAGGGAGLEDEDMNDNNDLDPPAPRQLGPGLGLGMGPALLEPQDINFIVDNPTLDLETYANSYTGLSKLYRLLHIADHAPTLKLEACKLALAHVVGHTYSVEMYALLHRKIRGQPTPGVGLMGSLPSTSAAVLPVPGGLSPNGEGGGENEAEGVPPPPPDSGAAFPPVDTAWMEAAAKKSALLLDKLDGELKSHKSNSIKESIRRGYDELGEYYLQTGDCLSALKSFTRSRDYCTNAKHVVNMCLNIIKVSIYLQNWAHVSNYVQKAESTPDPSDDKKTTSKESGIITAKLRCAMGLAELATNKYKTAARCFLQISLDHFECPELISQSNVAVYASLCALATFTRQELAEEVIGSSSFKLFLEVEPSVRDVIHSFHESKYAKCLQLLDEMKDNLLLDLYLAPHVASLYSQIRSRGLIQYFEPYTSADMTRMASSFNTTVPRLENELMNLILGGRIPARIDSHNKILLEKRTDERAGIFEKVIKMGDEYERKTKLALLRTVMIKANLNVKNPGKEEQEGSSGRGGRSHQFNNHL